MNVVIFKTDANANLIMEMLSGFRIEELEIKPINVVIKPKGNSYEPRENQPQ